MIPNWPLFETPPAPPSLRHSYPRILLLARQCYFLFLFNFFVLIIFIIIKFRQIVFLWSLCSWAPIWLGMLTFSDLQPIFSFNYFSCTHWHSADGGSPQADSIHFHDWSIAPRTLFWTAIISLNLFHNLSPLPHGSRIQIFQGSNKLVLLDASLQISL